jgi:hypothetical protein
MANASILSYLVLGALVLSITIDLGPMPSRTQNVDFYATVYGANIDVFSQRGGMGASVPSPSFCPGEAVLLYAIVAYKEWPEQNSDVTFQILNPHQDSFVLYDRTNASGTAAVSFCLPSLEHADCVLGTWRVIASVDVAEIVVDDTLEFQVKWNLADVNTDWKVDVYDMVLVSLAYASTLLDPHWNPHCDMAKPYGIIDIYDMAMIATNYGKKHTP